MIGQVSSTAPVKVGAQAIEKAPITTQPKGKLGQLDVAIAEEDAEYIRKYRNEIAGTCLGLCITVPIAATVGMTLGAVVDPFLGVASASIIYGTGAIATCGTIYSVNQEKK